MAPDSSGGDPPPEGVHRLEPLEVQSTSAMVASRLRAGIFSRRFPPDTQLNEVELARELNVSRGPIRDAFAKLEHDGLLRRERNRGVFVVALDEDSVRDVYFARQVIETAAALRLAGRSDESALADLDAVVASLEREVDGDWSRLVALDLEFHKSLVDAAGSERLSRAFEPLYAENLLCLTYLETHYGERTAVVDEHRAIVAAIRSSDVAAIEAVVGAHMSESAAKLTAPRRGP